MNKLEAIIVDDEINARENLRYLLKEFCKNVVIKDEASNVNDAVELIKKHQPDVVFLDIEMPQKNGFQLLDAFEEITFQIIFITAYDSYAIKAFQVAAIDYLLKPVDVSLLKNAVKKVGVFVETKNENDRVQLLKQNKKEVKKIAVPYKNDYVILNVNDILCIEADRMYSIIHTIDNKKYVAAKKLNYYETLFENEDFFIRIHRSWGINTNHIKAYSKKERKVELNTQKIIPVSKGYKEHFEELFES